jgi:glycosyltransferase involved in cell wall biosynthesis
MPTLSVIVPTRNRADLWRSGRLLDSLRAQDDQPDELVIAIDHTTDATSGTIIHDLELNPAQFPIRILSVDKPRPHPFPASGYPDNCLFHAAKGDVILHLDDDISLPPGFISHMRALFAGLPSAVVWGMLDFVDDAGEPISGEIDCRHSFATKQHLPILPGGIYQLPIHHNLHHGAVYTLTARDIRRLGGHNLEHCGWHNTDTRLGNRLARSLGGSYVTATTTTKHLGLTFHRQNKNNHDVIRAAQSTFSGPKIANGGVDFWKSSWFDHAYQVTQEIS